METSAHRSLELFFSYSHRDEELRQELEKHLTLLRRQGVISSWHDRQITAGSDWVGAIDDHTNSADIILLLVSADFLSSDYCYDVEMQRALERQAVGSARVIPVILRAVEWNGAPFGRLQALPTDGRPVTSWSNRDEAFADIARGVRKAVADIQAANPARRDVSYYFATQRQIIADHARRFVGRSGAEHALERLFRSQSRGYLIVRGGPGQGKTALAAHWVKQHGYVHHFVGRSGGRSDIRLILCSLLAQLASQTRIPISYSAALPEMAKLFEEALSQVASPERGPAVIVIDALDELAASGGEEASFLPTESLPDGVYVVVTSRPGERLDDLESRLARTPRFVYNLPPLDSDEIRAMVGERGQEISAADVERLVGASRGNPLYIETALTVMQSDRSVDASQLPAALDGYYRRATRSLPETSVTRDVLGVLAVSREPLESADLASITGYSERETRTVGLEPIREFLHAEEGRFSFYHEYFRDFVTRELLYQDELRGYHARVADWLQRPEHLADLYRWRSLAYHLYEAGGRERVWREIDSAFLAAKVRLLGYAVLDDVEYLTRSFLDANDPALIERCVAIVDDLRTVVGSDIIEDATNAVQFGGSSGGRHRCPGVVTPSVRSIPGVDLYVGFLPKGQVTADFVEVVPHRGRLLIAIGDAPSTGIKSAFVARFIANLFRSLVKGSENARPAHLLGQVSERISNRAYFERVSMQCAEIDLSAGRLALANAGHPFPVLYSARRQRCDRLPVRGDLLHGGELAASPHVYGERHAEIDRGDILVLLSDGLTEGSARFHDPFGYRFADRIAELAGRGARAIGESILDDWQRHPRAEDWADDVTVVVAVVDGQQPT